MDAPAHPTTELPARFVRHVRDRGLLSPGSRVMVACSGGADSTALALLMIESASALAVEVVALAHLDHGLREESADDLRHVASLCASLRLPFEGRRTEVRAQPNESPEEAARRVRYAFLSDVATIRGATCVLTAHHQDDQAETVLQRVLRGTGPRGLAGIPERRALSGGVDVVRPLLPFRSSELRAWLTDRGIAWREDPTNVDGNERARLRTVGLPVLSACVDRDPVPLLARLASNVAAAEPGMPVGTPFVDRTPHGIVIHAGFERLPVDEAVDALRGPVADLRGRPLTHAESLRLLDLLAGDDAEQVAGLTLERDDARIRLLRPTSSTAPPPAPLLLQLPGTFDLWDGHRLVLEAVPAGNAPFLARLACRDGRVEIMDAERLEGPLTARVRRAGDRLRPIGASADARLGHVLQRRGVAAAARDRLPLVCDAKGVVWAAGAAIADRVRVTAATRRIALLRLEAVGAAES